MQPWMRNAAACFLLGTFNNLMGVINTAGANKILPGEVGVIYIVNVMPELIVKATAPFWWHLCSYRAKIGVAGVLFGANIALVHAGFDFPVWVKLLGISLSDIGSGIGEASVLALSQFYPNPRTLLTSWSSGTGMAGILGYVLSMYVLTGLSLPLKIALGMAILLCYWVSFFAILEKPWIDALRGGGGRGGGLEDKLNDRVRAQAPGRPTVNATPLLSAADPASPAGAAAADGPRSRERELDLEEMGDEVGADTLGASGVDASAAMGTRAKLHLMVSLLRYVLPLMLVYWAEYAAQAGAWTAFALPAGEITSEGARDTAYQRFNLAYQVGVFCSRSSGKLFKLRVPWLWAVAWVQVGLLSAFVADAATQWWVGETLILPAFVVGLCGGLVYVQTQVAIDTDVPPQHRELALATACAGNPAGILLADVTGLFIQWCLFAHLGLKQNGAEGTCPFVLGNSTRQI